MTSGYARSRSLHRTDRGMARTRNSFASCAWCMTTIQVRNVPEETSRTLNAKAALEGKSVSDYLLDELERLATRPSRAELLARISE